MSNPARFMPIACDPAIADAGPTYGHIRRKGQGMICTPACRAGGDA